MQEDSTEEEIELQKEYRRALSLPITKQLVYYADNRDEKSVHNVVSAKINNLYEYYENGKNK